MIERSTKWLLLSFVAPYLLVFISTLVINIGGKVSDYQQIFAITKYIDIIGEFSLFLVTFAIAIRDIQLKLKAKMATAYFAQAALALIISAYYLAILTCGAHVILSH